MTANPSQRKVASFNLNPDSGNYIDLRMYQKAIDSRNQDRFDYFLSRTTNGADYSSSAQHEMLAIEFPRYDRVNMIGPISVADNVSGSGSQIQALESNTRTDPTHIQDIAFARLVNDTVTEISNQEADSIQLHKAFAFYLVQSGNFQVKHPMLNVHIKHFRQFECVEVKHLTKYVGSRQRAQTSREAVKVLLADILAA